MNDSLAADLYDLWEAGVSFLPRMGKIYEELWDKLPNDYEIAFSHPVGGKASEAEASWGELRNTVATLFSKSSDNLYDTGDAIVDIVDNYREGDQLNAGQLEELENKISDGKKQMEDGDIPAPPDRNPVDDRSTEPEIYLNEESGQAQSESKEP